MRLLSEDFKSSVYTIPPPRQMLKLEALAGIAPTYKGFAVPCITTLLQRRVLFILLLFRLFSTLLAGLQFWPLRQLRGLLRNGFLESGACLGVC